MTMDFSSAVDFVSLCGSLIAVVSTFYFWLVRANRERPNLQIHPVENLTGCAITPMQDTETYRRLGMPPERTFLKYRLHVAVVNNSSLPNAILGAKVWLQMRNGTWQVTDVQNGTNEERLFPANIDPLTTRSLPLALATRTNHEAEDSFAGRDAAGGDALPRRVPIRIELTGLNGHTFLHEFVDCGDGLMRTEIRQQAA